ncbi:hypothetical protein ACQP00_28960 [Dactylosporangium sp. CS-047395]|uniref:hypothetical protein n=1 Tax=Dactylosporangium sp. CS-047395 TaxID=3239936 RepID=UPI003D942BEC
MIALIWRAMLARRVVAVAMFLLAVLVSTGLSLAPWYAQRAAGTAATARIAAAPQAERTVSASGTVAVDLAGETVVQTFAASARRALALPVTGAAVGAELAATVSAGERGIALPLRYREGLCANAVVDGHCPQGTGEVLLSAQSAERLGVRVGDRLEASAGPAAPRQQLRLVGLYRPADPLSWYWTTAADAAWTTFDTVAAAGASVRATYDAMLSPPVFSRGGELTAAIERMRRVPLQVDAAGGALADRITADRLVVRRGVFLAAAQLAVLGWLAMAVAARYAAEERRFDAAQLALRGARRWRLLAATGGQTAVPLAAGTLAGAAVGVLADGPGRLPIAGGVLAAALAGAVLADWRIAGLSVERLLHTAAPRPPKLGTAVVEACVLAVAGAAVYQSLVSGSPIGVQLLAPGLLAASAAILAGRLLVPTATAVGRSALVNGRVTAAFGALLLARRAAAYRMLPLLTAAGCLLVLAAQSWAEVGHARHERAAVEVGGERVLTVAAADRVRLLNAVRAADPDGRQAMAVVAGAGPGGEPVLGAASAAVGPLGSLLSAETARHGLLSASTDRGHAADVDEWQQIVLDHGSDYLTTPSPELLRRLTADIVSLQLAMALAGSDAQRRELSRIGAVLAAFAAKTTSNVGDLHEARRWWRTANNVADESGDLATILWVRGQEIIRALYDGRDVDAVLPLVDQAEARAAGATAAMLPSLLSGKAQALALAGRTHDARTALRQLERTYASLPGEMTTVRGSESDLKWPVTKLWFTASYVHAHSGALQEASKAQEQALEHYLPGHVRAPAQIKLHRALCMVRAGDTTQGLCYARTVLADLPHAHHVRPVLDGACTVLHAVPHEQRRQPAYSELAHSLTTATASGIG